MLKSNFKIAQTIQAKDNETIEIEHIDLNEILINIPFANFTVKLATPLFDIEVISPALIKLRAISKNEFRVQIISPGSNLITVIPSLVFEVFNRNGVRIIRIVAPPIEE